MTGAPDDDYRIAEAAEILGVSDDTVRRWVDAGRLPSTTSSRRTVIPGADLAALAVSLVDDAGARAHPGRLGQRAQPDDRASSRRVVKDTVMAQIEMVCGQLPGGVADERGSGRRARARARRPRDRVGQVHQRRGRDP